MVTRIGDVASRRGDRARGRSRAHGLRRGRRRAQVAVVMTRTVELRVFDRLPSGALVGLETLLGCLVAAVPGSASWTWRVAGGAWGHGAFVRAIEDRLNGGESVLLGTTELLERLRQQGEYFEDVRLDAQEVGVRVAVVDSTFLQLVAGRDVVATCGSRYERVEIIGADT